MDKMKYRRWTGLRSGAYKTRALDSLILYISFLIQYIL
jgi:hypothetical protein